jgi:hypothetical protein
MRFQIGPMELSRDLNSRDRRFSLQLAGQADFVIVSMRGKLSVLLRSEIGLTNGPC